MAAPVDFGAQFVAPVVADLQKRNTDLAVDLVLGSSFADLIESGIDVAVRIGKLPDSSLIAKRIGIVPRVIVASRGYVEQQGAPTRPADLPDNDFIFYGTGQRDLKITFGDGGKEKDVVVFSKTTANSVTAIRRLVEAGCGLHLGPVWAFEAGLRDGSLVRILPGYPLKAFPLHALYSASSYVPAKTRAFIETFSEAIKSHEAFKNE